MRFKIWVLFTLVIAEVSLLVFSKDFESEEELEQWLHDAYEKNASTLCSKQGFAEWAYNTDVNNDAAQAESIQVSLEAAEIKKQYWEEYFKNIVTEEIENATIKREVASLKTLGDSVLEADKLEELKTAVSSMQNIYAVAKVCPYDDQDCDLATSGMNLEPGIESVIASSNDYDELTYIWTAWRNASGAKMRDYYQTYVKLANEAAVANGYTDRGALWRSRFEDDNFIDNLDELWKQLEPLYSELHTYVAGKLKEKYGDKIDLDDGLIPAHVFGNMWAQSWVNLKELATPFPNASTVDVTSEMEAQNYTVLKMFEMSDEFYQSLGLESNAISYNVSAGAMIEKPTDGREVVCHASAWDFCDKQNYRIKMCTNIDYDDFVTIHHEMGHIQYYILYKDQPIAYRAGANPGFHEAVGDTIALSVATPNHLQKIGLLNNYEDSDESSINALMDMALERLAFMPFGYLIDKWRWDVFSGNVTEDEWNTRWWYYRNTLQKVKAPVARSENDFDPGAKYHVAADSQYISYFVAHVLEFQFYKSLCIAAGEYNPENTTVPLHKCDFYQSTEAGDILKKGLSLGSSEHWSNALEILTGERNLNASAMIEYFKPLYDYLREENSNNDDDDHDHDHDDDNENAGHFIKANTIGCVAIAILFWLL